MILLYFVLKFSFYESFLLSKIKHIELLLKFLLTCIWLMGFLCHVLGMNFFQVVVISKVFYKISDKKVIDCDRFLFEWRSKGHLNWSLNTFTEVDSKDNLCMKYFPRKYFELYKFCHIESKSCQYISN